MDREKRANTDRLDNKEIARQTAKTSRIITKESQEDVLGKESKYRQGIIKRQQDKEDRQGGYWIMKMKHGGQGG